MQTTKPHLDHAVECAALVSKALLACAMRTKSCHQPTDWMTEAQHRPSKSVHMPAASISVYMPASSIHHQHPRPSLSPCPPVQSALKFSAVLGTSSPYRPMTTRPAGSPPISMSKKTLVVTLPVAGQSVLSPLSSLKWLEAACCIANSHLAWRPWHVQLHA